jgi:transcriptional regulator with XRE-family HTH domain
MSTSKAPAKTPPARHPTQRPAPPYDGMVPPDLGGRLRHLRQSTGMTLAELAEQAGFGKGYLSRIETGRKVPPIATLSRIAAALGTDVSSLLAKPGAKNHWRGVSVVRKSEKRLTVMGGTAFGYDYHALTNATEGHALQPFLFSFPAEFGKFVFFEHEGEELLHVLTGRVEWQIGIDKFVLEAGDTIHFDSRMPHRGRSLSGSATALVVMYSPGGDSPIG